jgi:dTDP-glucose 4,6-dehydratase
VRYLVTGGAGFIGSQFLETLLENVEPLDSIKVLDLLTYSGNLQNLEKVLKIPNVSFIHGDISNPSLVDEIMSETDVVIHFAAESHVDRSIGDSSVFFKTNVSGTVTLLQAAVKHNISKFVHVSTDEVYGSISKGSWTEEFPLSPNSPYAASKAGSDLAALAFFKTHQLNVNITRCCNNYGKRQYPEKVIPLFITNLLRGRKIPIYGNGQNIREWITVDDHCQGILSIISNGKPGEVYNLGSGYEISNIELARKILEILGKSESYIEYVPDRKGHDARYSLNFEKAKLELGFEPDVNFDKHLSRTIDWYVENEEWWTPLVIK